MRLTQSLLAVSLVGLAAASRLNGRQNVDEPAQESTNKYIVEIAKDVDYDTAVAELRSQTGVTVLKTLKSAVFRGVSVEANKTNLESLQGLSQIAQAWRSQPIQLLPNMDVTRFKDGVEAANYSVHSMTGVDRLHAAGLYGKGAKVAVVDTGVDYNHPALGNGFGPGFKVAGGYDLVGKGGWPNAPKTPNSDPLDQIGRGTHAAGIVAGKGEWYTGVAPEATILSYKVFTATDYTDDETIMEAFIKAYEDGADIITATFGAYDGWSTGAWATLASRLVDEGVVVTIAAGNSGTYGPFFPNSGANGVNVLSVGSAEPTVVTGLPIIVTTLMNSTNETTKVAYRPGPNHFPVTMQGAPVISLSMDPEAQAEVCKPLPADTPDLSGKVVLVRISLQCYDYEQVDNLKKLNPTGILFYHNPESMFFNPWSDSFRGPMGIVIPETGKWMIETLARGGEVSLDFSQANSHYVEMPQYSRAGTASPFSSWGATWDLQLKPDVMAPGALIVGCWLTSRGPWMTMSGTFSASPYVAGVAALYVGKHGGRSVHGKGFAKMLHARITSSASAMPWTPWVPDPPGAEGFLAPPMQVGSGLIDARKVLGYTTQLSLERFHLNDTHHFSRYHGVDITNNGDKEIVYTFAVQDAGGFDAFETDVNNLDGRPPGVKGVDALQMYKLKPEVRFPAGTFRVKPGQTRKAEFIFKMPELPAGHIGANMPIVSGKILIMGDNGEQLGVPYFGMVGDLKRSMRETKMWGRINNAFPRGPDIVTGRAPTGEFLRISDKPYWSFNQPTDDYPLINNVLVYGARELRWDIYEAGWKERKWKYPPVVGENGFVGSVSYFRDSLWLAQGGQPTEEELNDVVPTPAEYLNRQISHVYAWFGHLNNGSKIAPGNYTMRVATLLPFGNREASDNWDVLDLPEIMIKGPEN